MKPNSNQINRYPFNEYIVAFLDILGFGELVKEAVEDMTKAEQIMQKLDNSLQINLERYSGATIVKTKIEVRLFSDCACIAYSLSGDPMLRLFLSIIGDIQLKLALEGIFLRGGIFIGKHFQNERMIFSNALIKAYELERNHAQWPRVLIGNKVVELAGNENIPNFSIARDIDRRHFIDYLDIALLLGAKVDTTPVSRNTPNGFVEEEFLEEKTRKVLMKHKDRVIEALYENRNDTKTIEKYEWVRRYHNQKSQQECSSSDDLLIGESITEIKFIKPNLTFEDEGYDPKK